MYRNFPTRNKNFCGEIANNSFFTRTISCRRGGVDGTCSDTIQSSCDITLPSRSRTMNDSERTQLLADVEAFCQEIREHEELCYVEHKYNDKVIPLAQKHNILGMPVPKEYGGRGADTLTYVKTLTRIGRE